MESKSITHGMQSIFRSKNIGIINGYEKKYAKALGLECELILSIAMGQPYELTSHNVRRIAWTLDVSMRHIVSVIERDVKSGAGKISDLSPDDSCWNVFRPEHTATQDVSHKSYVETEDRYYQDAPGHLRDFETSNLELKCAFKSTNKKSEDEGANDNSKSVKDAWEDLARYWDAQGLVRRV